MVSQTIVREPTTSKNPPAVTPVVAVVFSEMTVIFWSIPTVKLFEYTSSADVGNVPPFQVAVLDQLPAATAYLIAIFKTLYRL
jgi:hypothetical protein